MKAALGLILAGGLLGFGLGWLVARRRGRRELQQALQQAQTDSLTGLANRRAFDKKFEECFERHRADRQPLTLALFDIDHFKSFNDQFGHQAGDAVLADVAAVLHQRLAVSAASDQAEALLVARYGGEEFAILFEQPIARIAGRVEAARRAIGDVKLQTGAPAQQVCASLGVAQALADEDLNGLFRRADSALYAAKSDGRDCCHWHDGQRIRRLEG